MPRLQHLFGLLAILGFIHLNLPERVFCQDKKQVVDGSKIAFYPDRWKKQNVSFDLTPWSGDHIVLLTEPGEYDSQVMGEFVSRLDSGWRTYETLVGKLPNPFKQHEGKPTICALPKPNLSCGYGCGYIGSSGIEVAGFYKSDLPEFTRDQTIFSDYYFYEMGRNYYVFGKRHSLYVTGYAVFMRYVCMDALKCRDKSPDTRKIIESCEEIYANSDISFLDAFTNLGSGEKSHRLVDPVTGKKIAPSDQPVMYAAAMLKMRRHFGGDKWVKEFLRLLHKCPEVDATDEKSAIQQSLNWFVCASIAARRNLGAVFVSRWRMPMTAKQIEIVKATDWSDRDIDVAELIGLLSAASN